MWEYFPKIFADKQMSMDYAMQYVGSWLILIISLVKYFELWNAQAKYYQSEIHLKNLDMYPVFLV